MRSESQVREMYTRCLGIRGQVASAVVKTLQWVLDPKIQTLSMYGPRTSGYYWIKRSGEWSIAEWRGDRWFSCGNEVEFLDNFTEEIGERIPDHA